MMKKIYNLLLGIVIFLLAVLYMILLAELFGYNNL